VGGDPAGGKLVGRETTSHPDSVGRSNGPGELGLWIGLEVRQKGVEKVYGLGRNAYNFGNQFWEGKKFSTKGAGERMNLAD